MQRGSLRSIPFHAPLIGFWAHLIPSAMRLPWDAGRWKHSAFLWICTLALLPLMHLLGQRLVQSVTSDQGSAAFFVVSGIFAVQDLQIWGVDHPLRITLLAMLAAIEFWGALGVLLHWRGFESEPKRLS